MRENSRRQTEYELIFITLASYIVAIIVDSNIIAPIIYLNISDIESHMNTLLQVQASIATLGIALISILAGISKDMIFGISVTYFIMQQKPFVFTHRFVILLEMLLIVISYISIVSSCFNTLIVSFVFSILVIAFMVWDIFIVFYGDQRIKDEIRDYCINVFKRLTKKDQNRILTSVDNDIDYSLEVNSFSRIKKDFILLEEFFEILLKNYKTEDLYLLWEESYINICQKLLKQSHSSLTFMTVESVCNVFKQNYDNDNKFLLKLWNKIQYDVFREMRNVNDNKFPYLILFLHNLLYKNLIFKANIQENNHSIENFPNNFYFNLLLNEKDNKKQSYLLTQLYDQLDAFSKSYKEDNYQDIIFKALANLTKLLIDNNQFEVLEDVFHEGKLNSYSSYNNNEKKYILLTLIYIYYLAYKEEYATEVQVRYSLKILKDWKNEIVSFMVSLQSTLITDQFLEEIFNQIKSWEIIQTKQAKILFMDDVVNEFILFYILANEYETNGLITKLMPIIKNKEFLYLNTFVCNNKEKTQKSFKLFLENFYYRGNNEVESVDAIERLEDALVRIYKSAEIARQTTNLPDELSIQQLSTSFKNIILEDLNSKIQIFNNKPDKTYSLPYEEVLRVETYSAYLNDPGNLSFIRENVQTQFSERIKNIMLKHKVINYKEVLFNDKDILNIFFSLVDSYNINLDTIIGYRNSFYGMERFEDYKIFESNMNQFKDQRLFDVIWAINSKYFYCNLIDVKVEINKLTEQEMDLSSKNEKGEYLYAFSNDNKLPFEKQELIDYFSKARRIIKVSFRIEYGFNTGTDNIIGVGVKISHK